MASVKFGLPFFDNLSERLTLDVSEVRLGFRLQKYDFGMAPLQVRFFGGNAIGITLELFDVVGALSLERELALGKHTEFVRKVGFLTFDVGFAAI